MNIQTQSKPDNHLGTDTRTYKQPVSWTGYLVYLTVGILFGLILTKSEAISWYRIQEMFRFQAFHMYGIIGTAVVLGIILVAVIKKFKIKDIHGEEIHLFEKPVNRYQYIFGGTIFGMGWALTGACPGPLYVLVGNGMTAFLAVIASAALGVLTYGALRDKLPH